MMAAIEEWAKADAAEVVVFDGLTVSYSDVWYVVKESVTEDALNIMVESTHKRIAETKLKNILSFMALPVA